MVMSCLPWQTFESVARLVMLVLSDSLSQKAHSPVSTFFHHFFYFKNLEVVKGKRYANRFPKKFLLFAHYLVSSCSLAQKHYSGAMLVFRVLCSMRLHAKPMGTQSRLKPQNVQTAHVFIFKSCRRNIGFASRCYIDWFSGSCSKTEPCLRQKHFCHAL